MTDTKNYLKQLDGLRFVAVTLVLADHWSADSLGFPASYLGVCLFFVLSGFLITRILLTSKAKDAQLNRSHGFSLKQFYIRRNLRIFPLYYLLIFVLFIVNVPPVREKIWWCLTYSTNIYIAIFEHWLGTIDHLWSLAVEEQFYLFFPFVIFFTPNKYLVRILVGFIILSVGLRLYFFEIGRSWITSYVLMPTCLDAFGFGGLFAFFYFADNQRVKEIITNKIYLLISIILYLSIVFLGKSISEDHNFVSIVLLRFFESLLSVFLVGNATYGFGGITKKILESSIASYIGRISYGIYMFHNFVYSYYHITPSYPTARLLNHLPFIRDFVPLKIVLLYVLTIGIATISWYLIEKPINKLKDKFTY